MPFKVSFKHYDVISKVIRGTWGAHKSKFASLSPSNNFHAVYHLVMTTHRVITGSLIKAVLHKFFCKFSLSAFCKFRPCSHYTGLFSRRHEKLTGKVWTPVSNMWLSAFFFGILAGLRGSVVVNEKKSRIRTVRVRGPGSTLGCHFLYF